MVSDEGRCAADQWQDRYTLIVHEFASPLKELHQGNPWPDMPMLPRAMGYLMTELWDRGFSQAQIREAFGNAIADMPLYAAGAETRS